VEIFKEIMVELIKNREIDLAALKKERREYIQDNPEEFQLNDMLLRLAEADSGYGIIQKLEIYRMEEDEPIIFTGVFDENGIQKNIRCSNVLLRVIREE
jgi:hypothetical protein